MKNTYLSTSPLCMYRSGKIATTGLFFFILSIILLFTMTVASCKTNKKNTAAQSSLNKNEQPSTPNSSPVIYTSPPKKPEGKTVNAVMKGEFRSTVGVMDMLSCYCAFGGYITNPKMGEVAVCFDKLPNKEELNCKNISVEGQAKVMTIGARQNNPCPAGEMKVIMATFAKCY